MTRLKVLHSECHAFWFNPIKRGLKQEMPKWVLLKGSIELSPFSPFYFDWWAHEGREVSCFCISHSSFWHWNKFITSLWTGTVTARRRVLLDKLTAFFFKYIFCWPCISIYLFMVVQLYYHVLILIELYFNNLNYFSNFRPLTCFSVMIPETV